MVWRVLKNKQTSGGAQMSDCKRLTRQPTNKAQAKAKAKAK